MIASGCSTGTSWPQMGNDSAKTFSSEESLGSKIHKVWDRGYSSLNMVYPVTDGERVYAIVSDGNNNSLVTLALSSGALVKNPLKLDSSYSISPTIYHDYIFLAMGKSVNCYNKSSLELVWSRDSEVEGEKLFNLVTLENSVLSITTAGTAFAVHIDTGMLKWQQHFKEGYTYRWIAAKGEIGLASGNGDSNSLVVAFNSETGEVIWEKQMDGGAELTPQIVDDLAIINELGKLGVYDLKTGYELWSKPLQDGEQSLAFEATPAITDDKLFFEFLGNLITLDLRTGIELDRVLIPENLPVKHIIASPETVFISLSGDPFLITYDIGSGIFTTKISGKRVVLGIALSGGIIVQSQEAITLFR